MVRLAGTLAVILWALGPQDQLAQRIEKLTDLTVSVYTFDNQIRGTGVKLIGPDGNSYVVTAAHVFLGPDETDRCRIVQKYMDADVAVGTTRIGGSLVAIDPEHDVALVRLAKPLWQNGARLRHGKPSVGEKVVHVGVIGDSPDRVSVTFGTISQVNRPLDGVLCDEVTSPAWYGSSGGGVFDSEDKLIGLVLGPSGDAPTLIRIVPSRQILRFLSKAPWKKEEAEVPSKRAA